MSSRLNKLQFISYTAEHGLPVGTVWKSYQDSCGYIWFGTENGLTMFNGLEFITYSSSGAEGNILTNNKVYDIVQGHNNKLYIATADGVTIYNQVTGQMSPLTTNDTLHNYLEQRIRSLYVESDSTLLLGTHTTGVLRINLKTHDISVINLGYNKLYIRSITKDRDNQYLISTFGHGFFIVSPDGSYRQILVTHNKTEPNEYDGKNRINQVFDYSTSHYWIATERGLFQYDKKSGAITELPISRQNHKETIHPQIRKIIRDEKNNIWIATYAGLFYIHNSNIRESHLFEYDEELDYGISSNRLLDVMEDAGGSIWISNFDVGVNVLHETDVKFHYVAKSNQPNSLPSNIVTAFAKHNNRQIFVGTIGGGLSLYNIETDNFIHLNQSIKAISSRILTIYKQADNTVWLGTWGEGLQKVDLNTKQVVTYKKGIDTDKSLDNNTVISILPDDSEHLWVATFNGLNRLNIKTNTVEHYDTILGINQTAIYSIFKDTDNTLWLGTNGKGLIVLNPNTNQITHYTANDNDTTSIASNTIHTITKATNGFYHIGTEKGISIFDPDNNVFVTVDETNGLSNNKVWGIIEDQEQTFWISGNKGITRYNPHLSTSDPETFKTFGKKDGLRSLEFSQGAYYYDQSTNIIYFGGTQGFYYFNPSHIKPREYMPQIQLASIKVMDNKYASDTSVTFLQSLTLPYSSNFLSFEFVSLDYVDPSTNLFQYKLSGQSEKWSQPSSRNYISFPDLKEGKYTLHIRGTNSEGYWSHIERSIYITITPPWWRTTTAYISYVILVIIIVVGYVQWRTLKLAREKKVLETLVTQRTKELKQKNEDITASIQYARRIQQAIIFPKISDFLREFPESFVFFRPKDIVSGDFFWFAKKGGRRYFAAADCTGHGVPGAFMSIVCNNLLEKALYEHDPKLPNEILQIIDKEIKTNLDQKGRRNDTFDGMDIALCAIDENSNQLLYAGAYRPLLLVRNGEITQVKPYRGSIGGSQLKVEKVFVTETIELQKGDTIYLFSDGITDQFGGPNNRKFGSKNLNNSLLEVQDKFMVSQELHFDELMNEWLEGYSQIDDIILIGVRFDNI